ALPPFSACSALSAVRSSSPYAQQGAALAQRVDNAHRHQPPGARVLLARDAADLEAQRAERALRHHLVLVALDRRVGDDADFGAVEAQPGEAHRGRDVDALGELQRALARGAAEDLA